MKIENKVVGYIGCAECGQIFYQTHLNQKYCCLHCAEQREKKDNKSRAKKYLQNEENHKKVTLFSVFAIIVITEG